MTNALLLALITLHQMLLNVLLEQTETICVPSACYTVHIRDASVNFDTAQRECHSNGGNLITIKTAAEAVHVQSLLNNISFSDHTADSHDLWIGLYLPVKQCYQEHKPLKGYIWISGGEESDYSNWQKEPTKSCTTRRCVILTYNSEKSDKNMKWSDVSCNKMLKYFMCKFSFKGMCQRVALGGPGKVTYTTPFATESASLLLVPFGSIAMVSCTSNNPDVDKTYICRESQETFHWSASGPLCATPEYGCTFNNGGCSHSCKETEGGQFICECPDDYQLAEDQITCLPWNYCEPNPCEHGCISFNNTFQCICPKGYHLTGNQKNCSDVDECASKPCDHLCINTEGSFHCQCSAGFKFVNTQCQDIDECARSPCVQGCMNTIGNFICYCYEGFIMASKDQCIDRNECEKNPCEDMCSNLNGSFKCSCREGYALAPNGISCVPHHKSTTMTSRPRLSGNVLPNSHHTGDQSEQTILTVSEVQNSVTHSAVSLKPVPSDENAFGTMPYSTVAGEPDASLLTTDSLLKHAPQSQGHKLLLPIVTSSAVLLLVVCAVCLLICIRLRKKRKTKGNDVKKSAADNYYWMPGPG
ncbi:complement component C1q receptor [Protopterus annectens]|uniref:complement component C1q receptor n=1 Tax=Protopterus annectens TaxID=7888 RepID=UPI001CF9FB66|nr:complement component C1q receptor [Protopterus annectens]